MMNFQMLSSLYGKSMPYFLMKFKIIFENYPGRES